MKLLNILLVALLSLSVWTAPAEAQTLDKLKQRLEEAQKAAKEAAEKAAEKAKEAAQKAKEAAQRAAKKAKEAAKKAAEKAKQAAQKASKKTKQFAQQASKKAKEATKKATQVAKKATKVAKDITQKAAKAAQQTAKKASKALKQAVNRLKPTSRPTSLPTSRPVEYGSPVLMMPPSPQEKITYVREPRDILMPPKNSALALMLNSGILRICVRSDMPPLGYFQGETLRGFDVTLAKQIASELSLRYNKTLKIQWVVINAQTRISSLLSGRCDLVTAAFSKTTERVKKIAFSSIYLRTYKVLLGHKKVERKKPIIAVVTGATTYPEAIPNSETVEYFNYNDILAAMKRGLVDYALADHPVATYLLRNSTNYKIQQVFTIPEHYAVGMHKHHIHLHKEINAILDYLARSGHIALFKRKWIK